MNTSNCCDTCFSQICRKEDCSCHTEKATTHEIEGWEKEFDEKFQLSSSEGYETPQLVVYGANKRGSKTYENLESIKTFIATLLTHQQERIIAAAKQHERFLDKVNKIPRGCWEWKASITELGYAQFHFDGKMGRAHRYSYAYYKGPIPTGLHLDHLCRNTKCVKPTHLEAVTNRENILRGVGMSAQNARKTNCKRGHELWGDNLKITKSRGRDIRWCRTCERATKARYRARERTKKLALTEAIEVIRKGA